MSSCHSSTMVTSHANPRPPAGSLCRAVNVLCRYLRTKPSAFLNFIFLLYKEHVLFCRGMIQPISCGIQREQSHYWLMRRWGIEAFIPVTVNSVCNGAPLHLLLSSSLSSCQRWGKLIHWFRFISVIIIRMSLHLVLCFLKLKFGDEPDSNILRVEVEDMSCIRRKTKKQNRHHNGLFSFITIFVESAVPLDKTSDLSSYFVLLLFAIKVVQRSVFCLSSIQRKPAVQICPALTC